MVLTTELLGIRNSLAEKMEKKKKAAIASGKKSQKYPNPAFFRAKDNINWKAQGKNLMEVVGIATEMFKEADHKAFWKLQAERCMDDLNRCATEFKQALEMSPEELKEVFLHGERTLGKLYRKGDMATV